MLSYDYTKSGTTGFTKSIKPAKKEWILEIELNGKMKFEHLMNTIYHQFGICHKVLSANVEYVDGRSFGTVQLYINVTQKILSN
jgi:ABC-type methionine transport system ATPase subunit